MFECKGMSFLPPSPPPTRRIWSMRKKIKDWAKFLRPLRGPVTSKVGVFLNSGPRFANHTTHIEVNCCRVAKRITRLTSKWWLYHMFRANGRHHAILRAIRQNFSVISIMDREHAILRLIVRTWYEHQHYPHDPHQALHYVIVSRPPHFFSPSRAPDPSVFALQ